MENEEALKQTSSKTQDESRAKKRKTKSAELSVLVKNIKRNTSNMKTKSKN